MSARHDDGADAEVQRHPTWLLGGCPPWCRRTHHEDDHPEDRYHQSEPAYVPAICGHGHSVPLTSSLEATDLLVRRGRHVDDVVEWLVIEAEMSPEPRLVLTSESARALLSALASQLEAPS